MPAAATDKFKKVGNPGTATTLSAPGYTVGATSLTVASTTNYPTDTGVCVSMYEVTTVGTQTVMTPGSYNEYNGVVSGATSITSLSHVAGSGTDRNYAAGTGTVVTIMVSSGRENDLIDGLLVSHNQDGTYKDASVTTAKLAPLAYAARASLNTNITNIASGALTTVAFNVEEYDPNNNFDMSSHAYIVPVTGLYSIAANASLGGTGLTYAQVKILANGNAVATGSFSNTSSAEYTSSASTIARFTAGTSIEAAVIGFTTSGNISLYGYPGQTVFSIAFLGN